MTDWASIDEASPPRPTSQADFEGVRSGSRNARSRNPDGWSGPEAGTARTGPLPLYPMTLSDVLDGAFKLLKANARAVFLVVAALMVAPQLAIAWAGSDLASFGLVGLVANPVEDDRVPLIVFAVVINTVCGALAAGGVSRIAAASYLGREMTAGAALRIVVQRAGPLLAAFVLVHLAELSGGILAGVGLIATMPLFMAMYVLVTPVIVVEEIGPLSAMRRSWRLVRPRFWAVLGTALIAGFLAWMLSQILAAGPTGVSFFFGGAIAWLLVAIGGVAATVIATPIVAITATLLYFDARIRHEGFDLQILAAAIRRGVGAD